MKSKVKGATQTKLFVFKELTNLTQWIRWSIYLCVITTTASAISTVLEMQLLLDLKRGLFASTSNYSALAHSNDQRQFIVSLFYMGVWLWCFILVARWIMQANRNARSLGARNITISPGWAVGWYFIPLANLWKPYQAMKEIWLGSLSLSGRKSESSISTSLLNWWWILWLLQVALGRFSSRAYLKAESADEFIRTNYAFLCSNALMIALCFVLLSLLSQINEAQNQSYQFNLKSENENSL